MVILVQQEGFAGREEEMAWVFLGWIVPKVSFDEVLCSIESDNQMASIAPPKLLLEFEPGVVFCGLDGVRDEFPPEALSSWSPPLQF